MIVPMPNRLHKLVWAAVSVILAACSPTGGRFDDGTGAIFPPCLAASGVQVPFAAREAPLIGRDLMAVDGFLATNNRVLRLLDGGLPSEGWRSEATLLGLSALLGIAAGKTELPIAIKLSGTVKTAFPEGKPLVEEK